MTLSGFRSLAADDTLDLDRAGAVLGLELAGVTNLTLSHSRVSRLVMTELTGLQHLDLRHNRLTSLPPLPSLYIQTILLSDNPWSCAEVEDPEVSWIYSRCGQTKNQLAADIHSRFSLQSKFSR